MPYTVKGRAKDLLIKMKEVFADYSKEAERIMNDALLTDEGKQQKIRSIQQGIISRLSVDEGAFMVEVKNVLRKENQQELNRADFCRTDGNYLTALTNTLEVLPYALDRCDRQELKDRLKMFENDPFAIAAIENKIGGKEGSLKFADIVPEDTRGKKQENLNILVSTINSHKANILSAFAVNGARQVNSIPAEIDSTIDYLNRCNDDCTEVIEAEDEPIETIYGRTEGPEQTTSSDFGFNFKGVR